MARTYTVTGFKKGSIPWNKGKHYPLVNSGQFKKGVSTWNKGIPMSESIKEKQKISHTGISNSSTEERNKQSIRMTGNKINNGRKQTEEHIKNALRRRPMSSLEIKFNNIILKNNLPYKFTGNGDFFVGRKNPDFVNTNGQKIAIEVFCIHHKNMFAGGYEKWKEDRIKIFNDYGWKIKFFNEVEVNEKNILEQLED